MFALVTGMLQAVSLSEPSVPFDVDSSAYVIVRFAQYAAMTLLIGCVAFRLTVLPRLERGRAHDPLRNDEVASRIAVWVFRALIILTLVHVARLAAQHRVYFEDGAWSMATMRPMLWQSGWGLAWLIAAGSMVVAFVAVWRISRAKRAGWWLLTAAVGVLTWTMAMSGHPAVAASPRIAMALDAVHIIGAGGWIGSLCVMMFLAVPLFLRSSTPDGHQRIAHLVAAFSPTALVFASLLSVTGVLAGVRNVGSWVGLVHSKYGVLLLVKLGLVALIAALGAVNWRRVLPTLGQPSATRMLRRSAVPELAAAVLVLVVTAWLVATEMPEPLANAAAVVGGRRAD